MQPQGNHSKQIEVEEIWRQKIHVPKSMTTNQVMEKYGLKQGAAYTARKKGFFVKNYSKTQVCIDPSKFSVDLCYNIAGKVFLKPFKRPGGHGHKR